MQRVINDLTLSDLSGVIGLATAPAFLLGATAALLSLFAGRQATVLAQMRTLPLGAAASYRLPRRLKCVRWGILTAAASGICSAALINVLFVDALLKLHNNRYIVLLFILALLNLMTALVLCVVETWSEASPAAVTKVGDRERADVQATIPLKVQRSSSGHLRRYGVEGERCQGLAPAFRWKP